MIKAPTAPQQEMPMPPMEDPNAMGGMPPTDGGMEDPNAMPPMDGGEQSDFDTNFDAGVDADEDTDPKKYIQQLTGKLSQTLQTYNNDTQGSDEETNKYVAKMIVAQIAKGLDETDKKELIKKINTTEGDYTEDEPEEPIEGEEEQPMEQEPIQECITKRQIKEIFNKEMVSKEEKPSTKKKNAKNSIFNGKKF